MATAKGAKKRSFFRLGFLIHDVSRLRRTVADKAFKPHGLTRSQFWVLSNLSRHDGDSMMQTELADVLDIGKVALGGLLDRLEASGLIDRVADSSDRRAKRIEMTQAGVDALARVQAVAYQLNDEMLTGVSPAELAMAEDIMDRMKAMLIRMDNGTRSLPQK